MFRFCFALLLAASLAAPATAFAAPGLPGLPSPPSGLPKAGDAPPANCFDIPSPMCFDFEAQALPSSVDEFLAMRAEFMKGKDEWQKAYGGASLFLYALMVRTQDEALGDQLVVLALDKYNLADGDVYKGKDWNKAASFYLDDQLKGKNHIPRAHAKGTKQSDGYELDMSKPVTLVYRRQIKAVPNPGSGDAKVFACTSGAPTCRPIQLKRNTKGIWKVPSRPSWSTSRSPLSRTTATTSSPTGRV